MPDPTRLLLIDDDPVFLRTLARSLERRGLAVSTAQQAPAALAALREADFDLVLLDLNLDGESGLPVLAEILRLRPRQRVVILTGYASVATAVEAIKAGADNYLCKPVNSSEILALLAAAPAPEPVPVEEQPLSMERLEWEYLQRVLREHNGNISATARALNMHRRTLQRKLQKRPAKR